MRNKACPNDVVPVAQDKNYRARKRKTRKKKVGRAKEILVVSNANLPAFEEKNAIKRQQMRENKRKEMS